MKCQRIQRFFRTTITIVVMCAFCFGCRSVTVFSNPSGAAVIMDSQETAWITPCNIPTRQLARGRHTFMVRKEGYTTVTGEMSVTVKTHPGDVVLSILMPLPFAIISGSVNAWKTYWPVYRSGMLFEMQEEVDTERQMRDRLDALERLKNEGVITEEELRVKRRTLLDSL